MTAAHLVAAIFFMSIKSLMAELAILMSTHLASAV
jgi:hypothetical protein